MNIYTQEDLRDQKIGLLVVGDRVKDLKHHPLRYETKESYFRQGVVRECYCECGKVILLSEAIIRTGRVKSCGCLKQKNAQRAWEKKQRLLDLKKKVKDYKGHLLYLTTKLDLMRYCPLGGVQNKEDMLIIGKEIQRTRELLRGASCSFTSVKKNLER